MDLLKTKTIYYFIHFIKQEKMKTTNLLKTALMVFIGSFLMLGFNSCSKDPEIPNDETKNKLHEDPVKMTIKLVECHLHADWNEIQKVGGPHQNPESPAKYMKKIQEIMYEVKEGEGWKLAEGSQSKFYVQIGRASCRERV